MLEPKSLRRADFVTSVILIAFSLWMLIATLQMPMKDTFGGVTNVWYVSPGLMPLFISVAIGVLGFVLLAYSIRVGGARDFFERIKRRESAWPESTFRFIAILLALCTFVYLDIPRIDFFLCMVLFLFYFVSVFYFEDDRLMKRSTALYAAGHLVILLAFVTGLAGYLQSLFRYAMDVLTLVFIIAMIFYVRHLAGRGVENRRRFRITMIVTLVVPLILAPLFRYALLVPLPEEGGIIALMNLVYYSLR